MWNCLVQWLDHPKGNLSSAPVHGLGFLPNSGFEPPACAWFGELVGQLIHPAHPDADLNYMPPHDSGILSGRWLKLLTQRLSGTMHPVADWCCVPGSGLRPLWAHKEQGGGALHGSRCNWWIIGTGLAQMDSGGLADHGRPGPEAG